MKLGRYLLVVVDYDSETLEAHSLEDDGEVYEYFDVEVGDKIVKDRKYKGVFEEAILLEVSDNSYFKNKDVINIGNIFQNKGSKKLVVVTDIVSEYKVEVEDMIYTRIGWDTKLGSRRNISRGNIKKDFELVGENFKLYTKD